jgi:phytoene dehydrogenase-like protein
VRGGLPGARAFALDGGALRALPSWKLGLFTTSLLSWGGRMEMARLLLRLDAEAAAHASTPLAAWLETRVEREEVRRFLRALVRVATYASDTEHHSAGAALAQVGLALNGNVLYLDGGWQTLVEGLRAAAQGAGVEIATGAHVEAVEHDGAVRGVRVDGRLERARAVVVATSPQVVRGLIGDASPSLRAFHEAARAVRAACLDVALSRLPNPEVLFALGFDDPLYFSVHSKAARIAPEGGAVVHAAKYLASSARDEGDDERELEALLDRVQPGWRDVVVERRFLPKMCVTHALVAAKSGGAAARGRRPAPAVPEIEGLYIAGDWVGEDGMLLDASLASARSAARLVMQLLEEGEGEAARAFATRRHSPSSAAHGLVSRDLS